MQDMGIPDPHWMSRCRLWTRIMDLLAGQDDEAQNNAEAYASTLDNHYAELVGAAYA